MGEIKELKLIIAIIAIIAIILGFMILLFELLWWQTYQTGFVIVGAVSVFVMIGGFYLIWRQYRKKSGDNKDIVADYEVQKEIIPEKKLFDTEKPQEVKANKVWVGITLIAIGCIPIVWGIIAYYMEEVNCPVCDYTCPCPFHSAGGMTLFAVNLLGLPPIIAGIIYPYRKRIKRLKGYGCILFFLFIGIIVLAMLLAFLTASLIGF